KFLGAAISRPISTAGLFQPTPGASRANLLGGVAAADDFATAVAFRSARGERSTISAEDISARTFLFRIDSVRVKTSAQERSGEQQTQTLNQTLSSAPATSKLPANLMQQLIDQVVRALDSRALAARERLGRF